VQQVIGVDGSPGGWLIVVYEIEASALMSRVQLSFAEILTTYQAGLHRRRYPDQLNYGAATPMRP